uniref:Uncharacterized protein n=1 Tax=Pelusios castaneus TaxID=367368 RepID=A0A8C8S9X0_9SAUR
GGKQTAVKGRVHLSMCLSASPPVPVCLSICFSISMCLSASPPGPVCLSACVCLFICLSISMCLSSLPVPVCLSACVCLSRASLFLYACLHPFQFLSFCMSVSLHPLLYCYVPVCIPSTPVCLSIRFSLPFSVFRPPVPDTFSRGPCRADHVPRGSH